MKLSFFILTLVIGLTAISATPAIAAFYRYIDKDGLEHVTNDFNQIPEEYREQFYGAGEPEKARTEMDARAEIDAITAEAMAKRAQEEAEALVIEDAGPRTILQRLISFAERHHALLALQIIAALAAIVGLFIIGGRLSDAFGHKRLTMLIMLAISAVVVIYLVRSNVQQVSNSFNEITGKVDALEKKLNKRQEKIRERLEESGERIDDEESGQRRFLENYQGASQ